MVHRLLIAYVAFFTISSLCTSIPIALANNEWSDLSSTSKFMIITLILGNWSSNMLAFINKTLAKLENNKPLFENEKTSSTNT